MNVKEFKTSYKLFLTNVTKHSKHSANKYVSYINKACQLPGMHDLWDKLANCDDPVKKTAYVESLCDAIEEAFDDPACTISQKRLCDCQSSAHVLLAFVTGQQWIKYKGAQMSFVQIFSNKTLSKIFKGRLRTQDRIYAFGALPIDLICKIATKHKLRTLWDELIAKTKIAYDEKGNTVCFGEVSRVMLGSDMHAYFEKDGQIYKIFTKIAKTGAYEELITNNIAKLSLDHDIPVERAFKAVLQTGAVPELKKLSDDITKRFVPVYKQSHKGAAAQDVVAAYAKTEYNPAQLNLDEGALLKETQDFLNSLSLTIMDRNQNSAKSNRP